jgi:uncharacterized RDD family membrane protein YckC
MAEEREATSAPVPPVLWEPPVAAASSTAAALASTWTRAGAYLLDSLLLGLAGWILGQIATVLLVGSDPFGAIAVALQSAIGLALTGGYFILFWISQEQSTLGMRLLRIRVGRFADGGPLSIGPAITRWIGLTGPSVFAPAAGASVELIGLVGALGFVWTLVLLISVVASSTKQGLHDQFAGSVVIARVGEERRDAAIAITVGLFVLLAILLPLIALGALFALGGDITDILTQIELQLESPLP